MNKRQFTLDDQLVFAKLSGDYNPIHVDPISARRFIFGGVVVHGIHYFLWALDQWMESRKKQFNLTLIKTSFGNWVGLNEIVKWQLIQEEEGVLEIEVWSGNNCAGKFILHWTSSAFDETLLFSKHNPEKAACRTLSREEVSQSSGSVNLCMDPDLAADLFPNLMRNMPHWQITEILSVTRLMGMKCPGLNTIISEAHLNFSYPSEGGSSLEYKVNSIHPRFSLVAINIHGPGMTGKLKGFLRPPPQIQADFNTLKNKVQKNEFLGQNALVIGGSRGLGEVTAKLLAAGGADVKFTYYKGSIDAQKIVKEITSGGDSAVCFKYNILNPPDQSQDLTGHSWHPTHLYYFATPLIAAGTRGKFSINLFEKFCDYYVGGFLNSIQLFQSSDQELKRIYYPSSVYADQFPPNMGEYAAAKRSGEALCEFLGNTQPELIIFKPRLPKTATDQTSSIVPEKTEDPAAILLGHLRNLRDL
jgi:hypothetical protein